MAIKRGYPNGQYPASALTSVGSGARLNDRAAAVFLRAVADAKREGVTVRPTPTTKGEPAGLAGYRSRDAQAWLRKHPTGPAPIAPVGSSTHGWGDAIDVDMGAAWLWKHRARYGLTRPIAGEPWHFQLNKTLAELGLDDDREDDDDMGIPLKIEKYSGKFYVAHPTIPGGYRQLASEAEAVGYRRVAQTGDNATIGTGIKDKTQFAAWATAAAQLAADYRAAQGAAAPVTVAIDYDKLAAALAKAAPAYTLTPSK